MKALVLSGGGAKGAFQVGVLAGLKCTKGFPVIAGSSVGALNASYLASFPSTSFIEAVSKLSSIWMTQITSANKIWTKRFPWGIPGLWKISIGKQKGLRRLVKKMINTDALRESGVKLQIPAVDLCTGMTRYFDAMDSCIKDAILASASIPVAMEPVEIEGGLYVDACVKDMAPLSAAIQAGADHITVITTQPVEFVSRMKKKDLNTSLKVGARVLDLSVNEILRNDIKFCGVTNVMVSHELSSGRHIELTIITPPKNLGGSMDFNPDVIGDHIKAGFKMGTTEIP